MKTILVTGAYGFIGSNFVHLLNKERPDWRVVVVDKCTYAANPTNLCGASNVINEYKADINSTRLMERILRKHKPQAVVNFAAESHVDRSIADPAAFLHSNVNGVLSLLTAIRNTGSVRFLQISTDEVYGDLSGRLIAASEASLCCPSSPYAASKVAADLLVLSYVRTYGMNCVITRSSNNYGPRQHLEKLVPKAISLLKRGSRVPLFGKGLAVREWVYVEDNCRAVLCVLEHGLCGDVYNVGGGTRLTNRQLIGRLCGVMERRGVNNWIKYVAERPGHDMLYALCGMKLRMLGWKPRMRLTPGLRETTRWY